MATKTVVCPECGSPSAPGRYACSECGAMLAAVAAAPRGRVSASTAEHQADASGEARPEAAADPDSGVAAADSGSPDALVADAATAPVAVSVSSLIDGPASPATTEAASAGTVEATESAELEGPVDADASPFDENAPLAAARAARQAAVLHDRAEEPRAVPVEPLPDAPPAPTLPAPSWPPPGDRGPIPAPEPRTPAGLYLPPSAVLPPLDGFGASAATAPASAGRSTSADEAAGAASGNATWSARGSAAVSGAMASVRVTASAARRAIAAGAALAGLGFLLPWVNTIPGSSPLANYLDRWGLVGAGTWVVLVVVVALAVIAASSGQVGSWPVGLPAVVVAGFLGGLVWPYLASGYGRSIGVLVVIVGALVLLVGGLLDRRARHDRGDASV